MRLAAVEADCELQVAQQREEKKQIAARALLAGRSFNEGDDLFDGLSPRVRMWPPALP